MLPKPNSKAETKYKSNVQIYFYTYINLYIHKATLYLP